MGYAKATEWTTADEVIEKTRTKHTIDGEKLFAPKDCLTHKQITAAFSWMANQYQNDKVTKPTQKNKHVEITFHENDEKLQAIANQLENFNKVYFVYVELKDRKNWKVRIVQTIFLGIVFNLDHNGVDKFFQAFWKMFLVAWSFKWHLGWCKCHLFNVRHSKHGLASASHI